MEEYKLLDSYVQGLVSIIIPTHNRAAIVVETIESVFVQTYKKIELIIVDDHSTDNTKQVIEDLQKKSHLFDFRYIKSFKKGGQAARNLGLIHSKGEFIQFFDDDDVMCPSHIEIKAEALLSDISIDFVTCNFNYFEGSLNNVVAEKRIDNIVHSFEYHFVNSSLPTPVFLCRRSCIFDIGFWNEKLFKLQDMSYFYKLFLLEKRGKYLADSLFLVRKHLNNISSKKSIDSYRFMLNTVHYIESEWSNCNQNRKLRKNAFCAYRFKMFLDAIKRGLFIWGLCNLLKMFLMYPLGIILIFKMGIVYIFNKTKRVEKGFMECFY